MSQALLFTLLFTLGCLLYAAYAYFKLRRQSRARAIADQARQANIEVMIDQLRRSRNENNSSVIESLPAFTYTNSSNRDVESGIPTKTPLVHECVICLSTVKEGEIVRVLPNCFHMFHVECIDMWLFSHSNCPICRSGAEPTAGPPLPASSAVVVPVGGAV